MEFIRFEKQGHVSIVTLNRPDRLNALGQTMSRELRDVENEFAEDPDQWVLIYTGTGRAFSAGLDLRDRVEQQTAGTGLPRRASAPATEITKPTLAAVHG